MGAFGRMLINYWGENIHYYNGDVNVAQHIKREPKKILKETKEEIYKRKYIDAPKSEFLRYLIDNIIYDKIDINKPKRKDFPTLKDWKQFNI